MPKAKARPETPPPESDAVVPLVSDDGDVLLARMAELARAIVRVPKDEVVSGKRRLRAN